MTWTLRIWHIDVIAAGDATLIVATDDGVGTGHAVQTRTVLIDGGLYGKGVDVHNRIVHENIAALDVMICTHYDRDHMGGLRALLEGGDPIYANTRVYDQGEPREVRVRKHARYGQPTVLSGDPEGSLEDPVKRYMTAIRARPHPTNKVLTRQQPDADLTADGWEAPDWAVDRDLMWDGAVRPATAPSLTCVAANQYIRQVAGGTSELPSSVLNDIDRVKNARSLGFLLTFGNFKYYVGGDLESTQEDGSHWQNGPVVDLTRRPDSLMMYLNENNNNAGRVHAMKTSHHGSKFSSSAAFIARLRPRAVFVSCGTYNQYGHPDQPVVNTLEAATSVDRYFLTGQNVGNPPTLGAFARVAGVWPPATGFVYDGDIRLTLTEAQAGANPPAFSVRYRRPDAGTNITNSATFAYTPHSYVVSRF
jgi:hypothetical protein